MSVILYIKTIDKDIPTTKQSYHAKLEIPIDIESVSDDVLQNTLHECLKKFKNSYLESINPGIIDLEFSVNEYIPTESKSIDSEIVQPLVTFLNLSIEDMSLLYDFQECTSPELDYALENFKQGYLGEFRDAEEAVLTLYMFGDQSAIPDVLKRYIDYDGLFDELFMDYAYIKDKLGKIKIWEFY